MSLERTSEACHSIVDLLLPIRRKRAVFYQIFRLSELPDHHAPGRILAQPLVDMADDEPQCSNKPKNVAAAGPTSHCSTDSGGILYGSDVLHECNLQDCGRGAIVLRLVFLLPIPSWHDQP